MTEKASDRRGSVLYLHYVDALANSAADYFRIRDCDAMIRFYIAAAIACNDSDNWFTERENQTLAEIAVTLFDAISFYKHRAEAAVCNLFAYIDPELRAETYQVSRDILWSLDTNWARTRSRRCAVHLIRYLGGPVHMLMRRYRFVEDGMTIGNPESDAGVEDARHNIKLWYRNDPPISDNMDERNEAVFTRKEQLLFPGFDDMLHRAARACLPIGLFGSRPVGRLVGHHGRRGDGGW
ncbi:hypothetical protein [Nocardia brasiliensis]|uniref:hypothetical protein n=1 Tax=Nocardia brasiliensis TaxID=37326 RepID=UPI00245867BA|nr:hypothetical protein [Nocardia brasiliensis]